MFKSLLKLFGGAGKASNNSPLREEKKLELQIVKSLDEYKNKLASETLTVEMIDNASDEDLVILVFENIAAKFPDDYKKEMETVLALPQAKQVIYITWLFDAEVLNGGFNQYYYNPWGKYASMLPAALTLIGAPKHAELITRANRIYADEYGKITKYQDGSLEGFSKSYDDNPLDELDDEFYDLRDEDELTNKMAGYIRRNKAAFIL